jgi:LytS/YehU family sensor histidine kinase
MEQPTGCLIVFVRRKWLHLEEDSSLVKGLTSLFSTQLELSEVDYQKRLRQKAEFSALQSQVNPHLLYNALNTIACICRESPFQARELIVILAQYYRRTLDSNSYMISLSEEIQQVNNYLVLEKARFEEKLEVKMDIPEAVDCIVPTLILQPIVENAVKYGVDEEGCRKISVVVRENSCRIAITVKDGGPGFPAEMMAEILSDNQNSSINRKHVGLMNVKNRLSSIFGEDSDFIITSSSKGTEVKLIIPKISEIPIKTEGMVEGVAH